MCNAVIYKEALLRFVMEGGGGSCRFVLSFVRLECVHRQLNVDESGAQKRSVCVCASGRKHFCGIYYLRIGAVVLMEFKSYLSANSLEVRPPVRSKLLTALFILMSIVTDTVY